MISIHLSDEEMTAAAAGEQSPRSAHHLQICSECQEQVQAHREALVQLRQDISYSAGRSAIEWGRQSRAIHQRIITSQIERTQARSLGFAFVSSALALALVLTIFIGFRGTPTPRPAPDHVVTISDAALLNDVENLMDEDVPDALQPADLLVEQMGGVEQTSRISKSHTATRIQQ
jgi:hypothetical protein